MKKQLFFRLCIKNMNFSGRKQLVNAAEDRTCRYKFIIFEISHGQITWKRGIKLKTVNFISFFPPRNISTETGYLISKC